MLRLRLTGVDVAEGEEPDANVSVHRPLLGFTVGAAAVVHEARGVSFWAGVYHSVLSSNIEKNRSFILLLSY